MPQSFPTLDGIVPSWADVAVTCDIINGPLLDIADIKEISSSATVEVGEQKAGGRVIAFTQGELKCEAKMTLYYTGALKLWRELGKVAPEQNGQKRISLVHFNITYEFTPLGSNEIFRRKILGARLVTNPLESGEGVDATEVECGLVCKQVVDVIDGVEHVLF
jgi:hypothetical protein